MNALFVLLVGAASAANSDVCTTAADYDGAASSIISGCGTGSSCDSSGYWICDDVITLMTGQYASAITACSDATVSDDSTTTEAEYTQIFSSSCCSGGDGVCGAFSYEYGSYSYSYSYSFSGECYYGCATCDGPGDVDCDSCNDGSSPIDDDLDGYGSCPAAAPTVSTSCVGSWPARGAI